jgi:hypothetical protein
MSEGRFEQWAIVEVMGHSRYAGLVTEQAIGGCNFLRVDVPEIEPSFQSERRPAFTKLFGASSIFAITLVSEAVARQAAATFRFRQFEVFEGPGSRQLNFQAPAYDEPDFEEEDLDG